VRCPDFDDESVGNLADKLDLGHASLVARALPGR
jgi:hypothetical protein